MCLLWFIKPPKCSTRSKLVVITGFKNSVYHPIKCRNALFVPDLAFLYKRKLPLIWSHRPSRRCPILHMSARWPTSGKWTVPGRVEHRRHIALPEDASARSSHLCLPLRAGVPSAALSERCLSRDELKRRPRKNIIRCGGRVDVGAVCELGSTSTHQLAERMWRLWLILLPSKGPS